MKIMRAVLLCTCVSLPTVALAQTKGWRGIVPLRSTRADVERLLGPPSSESPVDRCQCLYQLEDVNLSILYANGFPCGEPEQRDGRVGGWKVPRDTVIGLTIYFKTERKLSDLNIDESKYEKEIDKHLPGWVFYTNREEGIRIEGSERTATSISYFPSAKDNHLRCPDSTTKQSCNMKSLRP